MSTTESQRLQEQYGISQKNAEFVLGSLQKQQELGMSTPTPDAYIQGIQEAFKGKDMSLNGALDAIRETYEDRNPLRIPEEPTPPRVCIAPSVSDGGIDI